MTDSKEELVRRSFAGFRDGDLDALLAIYHEDAVWDLRNWEGAPDLNEYHGHEGLGEFMTMLTEVFRELEIEPTEIVEIDAERVFVRGAISIRGQASGAPVAGPPFWQVIEFRDGLIWRVFTYTDEQAARLAAG